MPASHHRQDPPAHRWQPAHRRYPPKVAARPPGAQTPTSPRTTAPTPNHQPPERRTVATTPTGPPNPTPTPRRPEAQVSPHSSIRLLPLRPRRLNHRSSPRTLRPPPGWPPQIPPVPSRRRSRISTSRSPRSADRHQPCRQPARQAWPPPHRVAARAPIRQPPWPRTARFPQHSKQTQVNPATRADPTICYPPRSPDGSPALKGQLAISPPEPTPPPPNPHPATNRSNPPTPSYRPPPTPATTGSSHPPPTPLRAHQLAPHDSSSGSTALWAGWRNWFE